MLSALEKTGVIERQGDGSLQPAKAVNPHEVTGNAPPMRDGPVFPQVNPLPRS